MKKLILVALVLVVCATFTIAAVQSPAGLLGIFGDWNTPNVGWNTQASTLESGSVQSFSFQIAPPWLPMPNVGWNT